MFSRIFASNQSTSTRSIGAVRSYELLARVCEKPRTHSPGSAFRLSLGCTLDSAVWIHER